MLELTSFTFNPFQENTYLLSNSEGSCWIIDPGMYTPEEMQQLTSYIAGRGLTPRAILNTHGHLDHIFGVRGLQDRYKIPFHIHALEMPVLQHAPVSAQMFGITLSEAPVPDGFIEAGTPLLLENDALEVRLAPGHSPGSVVFRYPAGNWVIGGDVLFRGSIGRTDLPGGDHETLLRSVREQLFTLPAETEVFPGHGPSTTIGWEQSNNPFFS